MLQSVVRGRAATLMRSDLGNHPGWATLSLGGGMWLMAMAVAFGDPLVLVADGDVLGMPAPVGLERFCEGRVYPISGAHLSWEAGTLELPPEEVRPAMATLLGAGWTAEDDGFRRAEPGMERFVDVVSILEPGPHQECAKKRSPKAKSVLMYVLVPK